MADMALCGSSKLSSSFVNTHKCLSSSESLLSAFPSFKFSNLEQTKSKQQKGLRIKAAAPTVPSLSTHPSTYSRPPSRGSSSRPPQSGRPVTRRPPSRPPGRRLMKKGGTPLPIRRQLLGVRDAILKPPLDDKRLADKFLKSPQLSLKTLPLLSSCLPFSALRAEDEEWMDEYMPEIKLALGYPLPGMDTPTSPDSPLHHLDTFLYVAFQHLESERGTQKYLRVAHSRLSFLGEYILELAITEYFLIRYPRETPACMRERIFALINKKAIPEWLRLSSLDGCITPDGRALKPLKRLQTIRGVFWALVAGLYLCMGMGEVYRFLFEVLGMDPDAAICQPKRRLGRPDADYVYALLEEKQLDWQEVSAFESEDDTLFAKPLLYRACVPPGMQRFRGNLWEIDSLPQVLQILGYPRSTIEDQSVTAKRNAELELGLQLSFLHPSVYKSEHPRFCNERLEFLGGKIQDVVMAEKLLIKHLDAPGFFIEEKHRRLLFNRLCGKYLREKRLQKFMLIAEPRKELFERARRLKNFATTGVSLSLHALAYTVYGKAEVRRLMFELLDFERLQMPQV